jgi:hypothetical protein
VDRDAAASCDVSSDSLARYGAAALGVGHQHIFHAIDEHVALGTSAYALKQLGDGPCVLNFRFKHFCGQQVLSDSAGSDSTLGDGEE